MSVAPAPEPEALSEFLGAARRAPGEPYRGLEPFGFAEAGILAAREVEVERLVRLVTMYRGVLLYGESGAGKTSLVNAGLLPRLLNEDFWPHRVRVQPRKDQELVLEPIRAAGADGEAFLPSAFDGAAADGRLVVGASAFPAAVEGATGRGRVLLVFDQFEELVTLFDERSDRAGCRRRALAAIVGLLRDPKVPVKLLFVFREDYLASLEPLIAEHPQLADQSLRVVPPPVDSAQKIIRAPFERFAGAFEHELSPQIATRVAMSLARRSRGTGLNLSELQVVCRRLWEAPDPADLLAKRGVEGILEDFLNEGLRAFPGAACDLAVALLTRLVTTDGTRNVVSRDDLRAAACEDAGCDPELAERTLHQLEHDAHLVRSERRRDVTTFEIVSEFLVPMIARRKAERKSRAEAERALEQAAADHERELADRRRGILRVGTAAAVVVAIIIFVLALVAVHQADLASKERDSAKAHELAAAADGAAQDDPALAERLALNALHYGWTPGGENALRAAVSVPAPSVTLGDPDTGSASCCAAFSRDGRYVVASAGGAARAWDAVSGKQIVDPVDQRFGGSVPVVRPDSQAMLVMGAKDGLRQVGLTAPIPARRFAHSDRTEFFTPRYSPDGSLIAAPSIDGSAYVWDAHTGALEHRISSPGEHFLFDARFTGDGRGLVTLGFRGVVEERDLASGRVGWRMVGARRLSVARRSGVAAIVRWDGRVEVRNARDGRGKRLLGTRSFAADSAIFDSSGRFVAVRGGGGARAGQFIHVWSVAGASLGSVSAGAEVNDFAVARAGRLLATAQAGGAVLWDVRTGAPLAHLGASAGAASSVAFSADGSRLVTSGKDGQVRVWDVDRVLPHAWQVAGRKPIRSAAFSPREDRVAIANADGTVMLATVPDERRITTLSVSPGIGVRAVAFSPNGDVLATASDNGDVTLWNASQGRRLLTTSAGSHPTSIAFSSDGQAFAASAGWSVRVWRTSNGSPLRAFHARGPVRQVAFGPDGGEVAAVSDDGQVRIWSRGTGRLVRALRTPHDSGYAIAYSRHGHYLAEGVASGAVIVWDARTGRRVKRLVGHTAGVRVVRFAADGLHLLSASNDGTARLWDWRPGVGAVVASSIATATSVDMTRDGRWLTVAGRRNAAFLLACPGCAALDDLKRLAERLARPLTPAEAQKYLHRGERSHPTPY